MKINAQISIWEPESSNQNDLSNRLLPSLMLIFDYRGFVAAALGEAALEVEKRHPSLVGTAASVFSPFLNSAYISGRARQVTFCRTVFPAV